MIEVVDLTKSCGDILAGSPDHDHAHFERIMHD